MKNNNPNSFSSSYSYNVILEDNIGKEKRSPKAFIFYKSYE
jgi:hypothetical protein